jgi:dihydroflavonol-4-reductase
MLHTISGATGLVGSHLVYSLLKDGLSVRALHRKSSDRSLLERVFAFYGDSLPDYELQLVWQEADMLDPVDVERAMEGSTVFYHTAALVSFDPRNKRALIDGNREMTALAINAALQSNITRFVHVSSVAALGRKKDQKEFDENSHWVESSHNSNYAKGKYAAEMEVWRGIEEGLSAAIVNPCIILGPGTWDGGSAAIFKNIAQGFSFYSKGVNAFVDVRDVVKAIRVLATSDQKERYLITAENRSYQSVFNEIAKAMDLKAPSIEIKTWMAAVAWRWEWIKSKISGKEPLVTKETARTALEEYYYINTKAKQDLKMEFRDLNESIRFIAGCYTKEKKPR